jgi:hypothetical protein
MNFFARLRRLEQAPPRRSGPIRLIVLVAPADARVRPDARALDAIGLAGGAGEPRGGRGQAHVEAECRRISRALERVADDPRIRSCTVQHLDGEHVRLTLAPAVKGYQPRCWCGADHEPDTVSGLPSATQEDGAPQPLAFARRPATAQEEESS